MPQTAQYHRFGTSEVLKIEETASEKLGKEEVLIQVHAVGLNPIDYKIFSGDSKIKMLERINRIQHPSRWISDSQIFPRGVGRDFSGKIIALGEDVSEFSINDRVFGTLRSAPGLGNPKGSLTTELIASSKDVARMPENVDFVTASTLGVAAQTVCGAFRTLDLKPTDTLAISAASGGIGSMAVQLAATKGLKVVGIASEAHQSYLQSLGATPINYAVGKDAVVERIHDEGSTKFLDCFGGDYVQIGLKAGIPPRGIGTLVPNPVSLLRGAQFTGSRHGLPTDLATIASYVKNQEINIRIEEIYPFTVKGIQRAYNVLAKGHTNGKLVIDFNNLLQF